MRFLTIVILVSVVLAGCADRIVTDSDYEVPRFDRPSVEHISPRNTSVNVPTDAPVSIWFDMLMDEESVRSLRSEERRVGKEGAAGQGGWRARSRRARADE